LTQTVNTQRFTPSPVAPLYPNCLCIQHVKAIVLLCGTVSRKNNAFRLAQPVRPGNDESSIYTLQP